MTTNFLRSDGWILLRRFRFLFVSFFVPYVNVFCHILHAFLLASHLHFVSYIFVLVFHVQFSPGGGVYSLIWAL